MSDQWVKVPGSALKISVAPDGNPWIVNNQKQIFRFDGTDWEKMPGEAMDISIGKEGIVWIVGVKFMGDGYNILKWNGNNWEEDDIQKDGVKIAVDNNGIPCHIGKKGDVYFPIEGSNDWYRGKGKAIGCGGDGSIWIVKPIDKS